MIISDCNFYIEFGSKIYEYEILKKSYNTKY